MSPARFDATRILDAYGADGDRRSALAEALVAADWCLERGQLELAASALDRAYGLDPTDEDLKKRRADVLNALVVVEHGLVFRYVPAGTFLMGGDDGDPDERPVHPVRVDAFHLADVPTTWAAYCDLMGWSAPPVGFPPSHDPEHADSMQSFRLYERNKIRLQYCESTTEGATDWHAHAPPATWTNSDGSAISSVELFGVPPGRRDEPDRPWMYDRKPMIAVSFEEAEELCAQLSAPDGPARYALPTEAQWEKAARGGRIGAPWPWGDAPPTPDRCDCDHFGDFRIADPRSLPPNGYGLHGMCGGVWEWTADGYWALAYASAAGESAVRRPDELPERVLRGGSWADCPRAVRVSQRMSRLGGSWRGDVRSDAATPNVGFRIARVRSPGAGTPRPPTG